MSQELERVYTINLGKVLLSPNNQRAKRAINMIREFARRHMKVEDVRIEEDVAHQIWSRGMRSPPRKIRVRMSKTEDGYILVSRYEDAEEEKYADEMPETEQTSETDAEQTAEEETGKVKVEGAETEAEQTVASEKTEEKKTEKTE